MIIIIHAIIMNKRDIIFWTSGSETLLHQNLLVGLLSLLSLWWGPECGEKQKIFNPKHALRNWCFVKANLVEVGSID